MMRHVVLRLKCMCVCEKVSDELAAYGEACKAKAEADPSAAARGCAWMQAWLAENPGVQ